MDRHLGVLRREGPGPPAARLVQRVRVEHDAGDHRRDAGCVGASIMVIFAQLHACITSMRAQLHACDDLSGMLNPNPAGPPSEVTVKPESQHVPGLEVRGSGL